MKKIFIGLLFLSSVSFGQLTKPELYHINSRDIKSTGAYSSFKLGKLIDSLILSFQLVNTGGIRYGTTSGTDTYTASITGVASYSTGDSYVIKFATGNTAAATLNINSIGPISIISNGLALTGGAIQSLQTYLLTYDGTNFIISNPPTAVSGGVPGIMSLFNTTGTNTTGTMDQNSITNAINAVSGGSATGVDNQVGALAYSVYGLTKLTYVKAKTTTALPSNTNSGTVLTATSTGHLPTIDGISIVNGDNIIVSNESNYGNGVYTVTNEGGILTPFQLTRRSDANTPSSLSRILIYVASGSTNGTKYFWQSEVLTSLTTGVVGPIFTPLYMAPLHVIPEQISNYSPAKVGEFIPGDLTSGSLTVQLPTAPVDGATIGVQIAKLGGAYNITVSSGGSDVFDVSSGPTTKVLTALGQTQVYKYKSSSAIWYVINNDFGNKVGLAYGGTNADLSATGGSGQYLKQSSSGANITVGTIPASDIASGQALTKTDDTNVTLTLGGTPSTALLQAASLTLGWTGTLAAGRLNSNVVQAITNDTNVIGSISAQNLTLGWTGTLAYSRFVNGTGLSVIGRSANSSGVQADITGTANQILRVNGAGTSLGFGSIDLSQSAAVSTSILGASNGGTGQSSYSTGDILYASGTTTLSKLTSNSSATKKYLQTLSSGNPSWQQVDFSDLSSTSMAWLAASGVTFTGANTVNSTIANSLTFSTSGTATANNQTAINFNAAHTLRSTANDAFRFINITPTFTLASTGQSPYSLNIDNTFIITGGLVTGQLSGVISGTGMTPGTYTSVSPSSSSSGGTGALLTISITSSTAGTITAVTTAGSGYQVNSSITFNNSLFGGSGTSNISVLQVTGQSSSNSSGNIRLNTNNFFSDFISFYFNGNKALSIGPRGSSTFGINDGTDAALIRFFTGNVIITGITQVAAVSTFTSTANFATTSDQILLNKSGVSSNVSTNGIKSTATYLAGQVQTCTIVSPGSSGTNGTYNGVATSGGSGTGLTVNIIISGNIATAVTPASQGSNYRSTDVVSATAGGLTVTFNPIPYDFNQFFANDNTTLPDTYGTNSYISFNASPTINQVGTSTRPTIGYNFNPTQTAVLGKLLGINIVPTNTVNGIGNSPTNVNSTWDVNGSFGPAITSSSGNLTLDATHHTIIIASGTGTYTVPSAAGATRRIYFIINQTGSARTISTYKDKSNASQTTIAANAALWIQSDGSNWYQIN